MMDSIVGYVKTVLVALSAGLAGMAIGIWITVGAVPRMQFFGGAPEWIFEVNEIHIAAGAGSAVCALAWMYVDYTYRVKA